MGLVILLVVGVCFFLFALSNKLDADMNTVISKGPYRVHDEAKALHQKLVVADLHADSLLWDRNLLDLHDWGHADLPRLQKGNVALQVFSTVTKVPEDDNYESNDSTSDQITMLAIANRWPRGTWSSILARATWQAHLLHKAAEKSGGQLRVIRTSEQLEDMLQQRAAGEQVMGGIMATEGMHALEGNIENMQVLYDAGFRMVGLVHFFDNEVGGSCSGLKKGGLTALGREVITQSEAMGMTVDLAHASPQLIDDVLDMATKPVVVSHGGIDAICPSNRNISDEAIQRIAQGGGVVGVGYWKGALCDTSVDAIVRTMQHIVTLVGVDHVALGSDFDGTVHTPFDTSGLALITQALMAAGFSEEDIAKIMGGNTMRVLRHNLPKGV